MYYNLGYNGRVVDQQVDKALQTRRETLLQYKTTEKNERIPLVVTYNPSMQHLKSIVRDLQPIIDNDPTLSKIFPDPPVIAYRQPPNLRNTLVKSKLTLQPNGTFPCDGSAKCKCCDHIDNSDIRVPNSTDIFTPVGHFNCNSSNLVYMIRCRKCADIMYIGETSQKLRKRVGQHRQSINNECVHLPVGEHFNLAGHSSNDMTVRVLKGSLSDTSQRRISEQKFILKFDTKNNGLNRDIGFLSRYTL